MREYSLKLNELGEITIYSDVDVIAEKLSERKSIVKTIPVQIVYKGICNEIGKKENCISVLKGDIKKVSIDVGKNAAQLITNSEYFFFPDLVYLAICMFANILQKKRCYFVQSSVVKYDDHHSVMFIGDPNSGKTTMAYSLIKNYGYSLISNDNAIIGMENDRLITITGTRNMQMRYGAIKTYFPEIIPHIQIKKSDINRNDWDIKVYIDEYMKKNKYKYAEKSIVTDIYNIKTYKEGSTYIREREKIDEILLIYEHLTKQIRSNRYVLYDYDYPIPSFESEEYMQDRYNIAKKICETVNVYDANGPVKELSRRIVKKYEK